MTLVLSAVAKRAEILIMALGLLQGQNGPAEVHRRVSHGPALPLLLMPLIKYLPWQNEKSNECRRVQGPTILDI